MAVKLRSAVGIALIWVATVAGVAATAWVAIDRAGRDLTSASAGASVLPPASVGTAVATTTPRGGPSRTDQTPDPSESTTSGTAPGSTTPRDRSVSVAGGQVSVRCTGATILLRIAQPDNGWRVDVDTAGRHEVDVRFRRGAEDAGPGTHVTAVCASGTPTFKVENKS